jgi:glycosyltransferase involved in cell wall biosynthesis
LRPGFEKSSDRLALIYYPNGSGGTAYERHLLRFLQESFDVTAHPVQSPVDWPRWARTPAALIGLYRAVHQTSAGFDLVVDTLDASLLRRRGATRNWVIVHHLDFSANRHARIYEPLGPYILRCLRGAEKVVAVSMFWKRYLQDQGIPSVELIYNPFPVEEFSFSDDEVEGFKRQFGLVGKPILYLGNRAEGKGVEQAYRALRGIDAHFVATGKDAKPFGQLRTEYLHAREYHLLLKASTLAVTMSTFDEGWCRNAHETMLCETPVVGSGRGGMGELLRGGDQVICENFDELSPLVSSLLADPPRCRSMGRRGCAFAKQFTVERFNLAWRQLLERSMRQPELSTG